MYLLQLVISSDSLFSCVSSADAVIACVADKNNTPMKSFNRGNASVMTSKSMTVMN